MGILSFFAAPFDKIIDSVGKAFDDNFTSDEERLEAKQKLIETINSAKIEMEKIALQQEQELSKRHEMDMKSDDIWSKRIRPASLAFLLAVVSVLAVTDGNIVWNEYAFIIKSDYIDLFQSLLLTAFAFYFGGRSLEKYAKIKNTRNKD